MMSKNPPSDSLKTLHAPWDHNKNSIWLASTVRICRNIEKCKFPQKLEQERKNHLLEITSKAALQAPGFDNPYLLKADKLTAAEKEFLIEHFLLFEGFQEARDGSAFCLDAKGETIVIFNIKEHVQIQCTDCSEDIENAWTRAVAIEEQIAKESTFAFSDKFGFLTAEPTHCGTGLLVSAYLHVPALIHKHTLTDHLEKEKSLGIVSSGLQGSPDDLVGDILMVRNVQTLGLNEESIISGIRNTVLRLIVAEKDARSSIKNSADATFKDHISRAIGLIKHSYKLDAQEALSALSFIKLGCEMAWVKGITVEEVNTLFFESRRSHLTYLLKETNQNTDIAVRRAEYLRDKGKDLAFTL